MFACGQCNSHKSMHLTWEINNAVTAVYLPDTEVKMSVERDHEDWSRICHISHARSETTEYPSARFAVGEEIGSTTLVAMICCVEPAWVRHGSSHTDLSTKFS